MLILVAVGASAETHKGIGPLDTLADVKIRFPNASFEKLDPAWAQPEDVLYKVTGAGLSGAIVIKFYDMRPGWRRDADTEQDEEQRALLLEMANDSDDSVDVEWVRWVPDAPIPLPRFVSKYGAPDKRGFDDDDLQPFRAWETRGLVVYLSDDEKAVVRVDYVFTIADRCRAWTNKYGKIPARMKDDCTEKPKPRPKK